MNADNRAMTIQAHRPRFPGTSTLLPVVIPALFLVGALFLIAGAAELRSQDAPPERHGGRSAPSLLTRGTAAFQYHAPDDLAAWTAMEALIPEGGEGKRWIDTAAGSETWEERSPRLSVKGRRPGASGQLVGYSRLEADREEAESGATRSAVRHLAALVIWRVRDRVAHGLVGFEEVAKLAEAEAAKAIGGARMDVFEQSVDRPYGRLHRAAVLVGADEKFLDALTEKVEKAIERSEVRARAQRHLLYWKGGIAGVLTALAAMAYCILNALTKGYFSWRLRALTLLGLGAAYAAIVLIRV